MDINKLKLNFSLKLFSKKLKQKGRLQYNYVPFKNLMKDEKLGDFTTNNLKYSLNNPVQMEISESYDNSVDILINDDKNPPRIINSRFTVTEGKTYEIIDRTGDKDTNIYDDKFIDNQTRLFKVVEKPLKITLNNISEGGQLLVGNYKFYFKYADIDGNETKIIDESNSVSIYFNKTGSNGKLITWGGQLKQKTNKSVTFDISNIDTSYQYIYVYYTLVSGEHETYSNTYKILNKYEINTDSLTINITGFENIIETTEEILNLTYDRCNNVKTQTQIQNMLFFGNVDKSVINYKELSDLSLRIYPTVEKYTITDIDFYKKHDNIYNYVGYWPEEIYRFGVIYTMNDDTETSVFNITGYDGKDIIDNFYNNYPLYDKNNNRNYISKTNSGFYNEDLSFNQKGVFRFTDDSDVNMVNSNFSMNILGVKFNINDEIHGLLKNNGVKSFKFVRQKRSPLLLAQGLTTYVDKLSHSPTYFKNDSYWIEGLLSNSGLLTDMYDHKNRSVNISNSSNPRAIICPEILNNKYLQSIFNSSSNNVKKKFSVGLSYSDGVVSTTKVSNVDIVIKSIDLLNVGFGTSVKYNGKDYFSSMLGTPEDPSDASYIKTTNDGDRTDVNGNLIYSTSPTYNQYLTRGYTTPYLAIKSDSYVDIDSNFIYNIYISDYSEAKMRNYFSVRMDMQTPYHSVCNWTDSSEVVAYNGDMFISNYYYRTHTGFKDLEFPLQTDFVDVNNFDKYYTPVNIDKSSNEYTSNRPSTSDNGKNFLPLRFDNSQINRADVNKVQFGIYVGFPIMSNYNLNLRSIDERDVDDMVIYKQGRTFYPYEFNRTSRRESDLYNQAYNTILSPITYFLTPDVPYIKHLYNNRIMFSMKKTSDGFSNPNRLFHNLAHKDYGMEYGAITKILNWSDNLLVVFENGIGLLHINEKALIPSEGQSIALYGNNVLPEKPQMISVDYGSRWVDSIIEVPGKIYGVDTEAKKIWRLSAKGFEIISDMKIQSFLNDNLKIDRTTYTPLIGLRNVKSHYNAYKQDVMFTFYNHENLKISENDSKLSKYNWNVCFNELLNRWVTRYTWTPLVSENINNVYFSFDQKHSSILSAAGYSKYDNDYSFGITVDDVDIKNTTDNVTLKLSKTVEDEYSQFNKTYSFINGDKLSTIFSNNNNVIFEIKNDEISINTNAIFNKSYIDECISNNVEWKYYILDIDVRFTKDNIDYGNYQDTIVLIPNSDDFPMSTKTVNIEGVVYENMSYQEIHKKYFRSLFWKHGQAGDFYENDYVKCTKWYGKQEPFEFEFVINDNPVNHKIFENLYIISNNVEPESITYEIVGDSYFFSDEKENIYKENYKDPNKYVKFAYSNEKKKGVKLNYDKRLDEYKIQLDQPIVSMSAQKDLNEVYKLIIANSQYQEDKFIVQIDPLTLEINSDDTVTFKQTKIRDRYIKVRIKYSGNNPVIIQAIQSIYSLSIS